MKAQQEQFEIVPRHLTAKVNNIGTKLRMVAVESSMVIHIGLCPLTSHLILRYNDEKKKGFVYEYEFYAYNDFIELLSAESIGRKIHSILFDEDAVEKGVNYRRRHDLERQFNSQIERVNAQHLAHDKNIFEAGERSGFNVGMDAGLEVADVTSRLSDAASFRRIFGFYPEEIASLDVDLSVDATKKTRFFGGNEGMFDAFAQATPLETPLDMPEIEDLMKAMRTAESYGMVSLPATPDLSSITAEDVQDSFRRLGFPARSTQENNLPDGWKKRATTTGELIAEAETNRQSLEQNFADTLNAKYEDEFKTPKNFEELANFWSGSRKIQQ